MNVTELSSRLPLPAVADASAVRITDLSVSARLTAATGNQLLGLDVWAGASAAERLLGVRTDFNAPSTTQLDQLVNHILAPLG